MPGLFDRAVNLSRYPEYVSEQSKQSVYCASVDNGGGYIVSYTVY